MILDSRWDPNQLVRDRHPWRKGKKVKEAWRNPNQLVKNHLHLWRKERMILDSRWNPNQLMKDHHQWRKERKMKEAWRVQNLLVRDHHQWLKGHMKSMKKVPCWDHPKPTGEGPPPMAEREYEEYEE